MLDGLRTVSTVYKKIDMAAQTHSRMRKARAAGTRAGSENRMVCSCLRQVRCSGADRPCGAVAEGCGADAAVASGVAGLFMASEVDICDMAAAAPAVTHGKPQFERGLHQVFRCQR